PDTKADVHGVALKVMGVEGTRAEGGYERQTQDFLMIDSPYLMVGTIADALRFDRASLAGSAQFLWHLLSHPAEAVRVMSMLKKPLHPLAGTFSCATDRVRSGLREADSAERPHALRAGAVTHWIGHGPKTSTSTPGEKCAAYGLPVACGNKV